MAISIRNTTSNVGHGSSSSASVNWTQSCAVGDVVVLFYGANGVSGGTPTASFSTSGGESFVSLFSQQMTPTGNAQRGQVGYFVITTGTSTPSNRTFTVNPGGTVANGFALNAVCLKGVDGTTPVLNSLVSSSNTTGTTGQVGPLSLNVTQAGAAFCVGLITSDPNAAPIFQGTGYTDTNTSGNNGQGGEMVDAYVKVVSATGVPSDAFWNTGDFNWIVAFSMRAALLPEGPVQTNLTKLSMSAAGIVTNKGVITTHLTKASIAAVGKGDYVGHITTSLTKISQTMITLPYDAGGPITTRLQKIAQVAQGKQSETATITTALSRITQVARVEQKIIGSIGPQALKGLAMSAQAKVIFGASIVMHLPANFAQSLTALEEEIAVINTRLGSTSGQTIGNVVQAEQIIIARIAMTLGPFNMTILGAQLGQPGAGKWYSYRYLDS